MVRLSACSHDSCPWWWRWWWWHSCPSVSAQLNFSPGWGKRAAATSSSNGGVGEGVSGLHPSVGGAPGGVVPSSPGSSSGDSCGPIPVSAVMHIYRLIRSEAVRLVQCQDEEYLG
uniref:Red pigment concentrating hormone n=1 Tax=Scylla paramamosain TaxID=85552 RepID=E2JEQ4_SCYPA|nr:red pigment concentrating hormone precursor [Scylla paramamosain]